jgi:hypothetical protein
MPGPVVHVNAGITCPHAGMATIIPSQARVLVSGQPVATIASQTLIAGCPFTVPAGPGPKPQPCLTARWLTGTVRVLVSGQPALVQSSSGLCLSAEQIPGGPPIISVVQPRVIAT